MSTGTFLKLTKQKADNLRAPQLLEHATRKKSTSGEDLIANAF